MARKYEFRPDKPRNGLLSKLFITQKQRRGILKWSLYALVLLVLSVLQDVILCRVNIFGATTDLVPCGIFVICVVEGAEKGCVFALCASMLYLFSGTAPGVRAIIAIAKITSTATHISPNDPSACCLPGSRLFLYSFPILRIGCSIHLKFEVVLWNIQSI